ncbi:MAG: SRPBCC family protein [Phycisphaerales bacterium]
MNITVSETINAPLDRVFAVASDIPNCASFIKSIETIETLNEAPLAPDNIGPVGKGYTWRETRIMFGKVATEDMTITQWSPSTGYIVEARSHGSHYLSSFTFESVENQDANPSTRMTMSFTGTPETFMAKVMMKVFTKLFKKLTVKLTTCLEDDLRDIKIAAELD